MYKKTLVEQHQHLLMPQQMQNLYDNVAPQVMAMMVRFVLHPNEELIAPPILNHNEINDVRAMVRSLLFPRYGAGDIRNWSIRMVVS